MKKYVLSIFIIPLLFISGCFDEVSGKIVSPSGKYLIYATANGTDKNKPNYLEVVLHLEEPGGTHLYTLVSKASHVHKWSLGWLQDSDVVVLQSSDVGVLAYNVEDGTLKEIGFKDITEEIHARSKELYQFKYGN